MDALQLIPECVLPFQCQHQGTHQSLRWTSQRPLLAGCWSPWWRRPPHRLTGSGLLPFGSAHSGPPGMTWRLEGPGQKTDESKVCIINIFYTVDVKRNATSGEQGIYIWELFQACGSIISDCVWLHCQYFMLVQAVFKYGWKKQKIYTKYHHDTNDIKLQIYQLVTSGDQLECASILFNQRMRIKNN